VVTRIRLDRVFGQLVVRVDIENIGDADADQVNLEAKVTFGDASTETIYTRTNWTPLPAFPAGTERKRLLVDFVGIIGPDSDMEVRVEVDPPIPATTGEYDEADETNNVRCTQFSWNAAEGEYDEVATSEDCPE
jgi:hypothetical protein